MHCFLLYDPYDASIDWEAIKPFFNLWGEVLINHMISDTTRAIKVAKHEKAIKKYERTYLEEFTELIGISADKAMFESRIEEIVQGLTSKREKYFISVFPFFNKRNALLYYLIFGTANEEGFKLFKRSAWKAFEGHSSVKREPELTKQFSLNFDALSVNAPPLFSSDDQCYGIVDVANYLYRRFYPKTKVPLHKIWSVLDLHPVFPSDGFKNEIKNVLQEMYKVKFFSVRNPVTKKRESFVSFC